MKKKVKWIIWGILFCVVFVLYQHGDCNTIVNSEINFIGAIFEGGGIQNYYSYCGLNDVNGAPYGFIPHFIMGIWGLPLYVLVKICGEMNFLIFLLGKCMLLFYVIVAILALYKICKILDMENVLCECAVFLFCSSILIMMSVAFIGQCDIIGVAYTLWGFYYYINDDCDWKWLLLFAVAFSFKLYAVIIFLPLILLREKNLLKIAGKVFICIFPHFLLNLIFQGTVLVHFQVGMTRLLLDRHVPFMNGQVPAFVILYGAICVYSYLYQSKDYCKTGHEIRHAILVATTAIFSLFLLYPGNSYAICTITPWFVLMIVSCVGHIKVGLLLESVGMLALAGAHFIENSNMKYCTPKTEAGYEVYMNLIEKINVLLDGKLSYIVGAIEGVSIVCLSTILFLGFRNYKEKTVGEDDLETYSIYRMIANCCLAMVPLFFDLIFG